MSKISFSIIPFIFIILLSVFFFVSPHFFGQEVAGSDEALKEILVKRYMNVGNLIAHATFVEDALIMEEVANLGEVISRFRRDDSEITFIHFTDINNKVIASSDPNVLGKTYTSALLESGPSVVKENNGTFEGGFSIRVGKKRVGALYFGAKPDVPVVKASAVPNPIILLVGLVVGIVVFVIAFSMQRNLEVKIVEDINRRQEEVFSPKIESLKEKQDQAQEELNELNGKIKTATAELIKMNAEFDEKKRKFEDNPVMQSIEKLRGTESVLIENIEKLKEEEQKLTKEISLLSQKREEVRSALEAEKKEESTLHEKLDLIKKKILHLETPKK